ncbi:MAG: FAD-dependent oxidoreductase [Candidatus Omnitrophota bacterium]
MSENVFPRLSILGGGPAGLAVGYFARRKGIPFTIYEASGEIGGNARTLKHGDFMFDTGAHRWHDKDAEITEELFRLMGDDLHKVEAPSQTYHNKKFIDFPLSPLNLFLTLGPGTFFEAGFDFLRSRLGPEPEEEHFEAFAVRTYGRTIASRFLLNYSEKLWGAPCNRLSPKIAGKRLKGLDLKTFLTEAVFGRKAKTEHLDGTFFYPKKGIGVIPERLAERCGWENIRTNSPVTRIFHDGTRVTAIQISGKDRVPVEHVVSTLPGPLFLKLMDPAPSPEILSAANGLRFRNLRLVILCLNKESVSPNASVYFPDAEHPFTRIYEPRNRSRLMVPEGKTSLVAEVPCQPEDELWKMEEAALAGIVAGKFTEMGWIRPEEVIDAAAYRIPNAYPIIELGSEEKAAEITGYLAGFRNVSVSGRSGKFMYTHLHDMLRFGKEIVAGVPSGEGPL